MKKILILSANPKDTNKLRLDEEVREIQAALKRANNREQFEIVTEWAVRVDDLRRALLDHEPTIVHFCGHGAGSNGLALENNFGQVQLVSTESLAKLFKLFKNTVECVLLNACYSEAQAEAIYQHIDYVIGMNRAIGDRAAIEFAVGFYDALGAGRTYEDCFEIGCASVDLEGIPESETPVLKARSKFSHQHTSSDQQKTEPQTNKTNTLPIESSTPIKEKTNMMNSSNTENIDKRSGGIYFGDSAIVQGDVVGRDKIVTTTTTTTSGEVFPKDKILQLLAELKTSIKEASIDEDEKDMATGQIAAAISETKKIDVKNPQTTQEKIGKYLAETKTILDRVKDIGEIGSKAFPILTKLAKLVGITII